jgi:hypothetical protein
MAGLHTAEHDRRCKCTLCAKASFAAEAGRTESLQSVNVKPAESADKAEARFTLVNAVRVAGPDRITFWDQA